MIIKDREDKVLRVSEYDYLRGLLHIVYFLFNDLEKLLFLEGRYFGITVIYMGIVRSSYRKIREDDTQEDLSNFGRILYLFKPQIMREYKRLRKRKVSEADCVIAIIKKILDIVIEDKDNQYYKNIKNLHKLTTKLFDNIRNHNKNSNMYSLVSSLKSYINSGIIGKHPLMYFSVIEEDKKRERNKQLNSKIGTKIDLDSDNKKIKEIEWND